MEQRPLRLGDLVDDFCPRERRITNHAIVAIVNDAIRQTRCTTCDAEHVFKGAKLPPRRSRRAADHVDEPGDNAGGQLVAPQAEIDAGKPVDGAAAEAVPMSAQPAPAQEAQNTQDAQGEMNGGDDGEQARPDEVWSANRTLIRATLPRVEGDAPPPRPIPEFTMHRYNGRDAGAFRHGRGWSDRSTGHGNGSRGDRRQGSGNGSGFGGGHGHGRRRHGKKRPR